jgi:hypothetical protein
VPRGRTWISNVIKSYKQRGHFCYVYIGLRFTIYVYLPPLVTLWSFKRVHMHTRLRSLVKRSPDHVPGFILFINVYTLILRIFTDLHTCRQGSESIVLAGKDTMTPVLRIGSLYRGLDTYISLFLKKSYKQRGHLCYVHIGLRFTTCVYLPPLVTLRSFFYRKS